MDYNIMETQLTGEYREVFKKAQLYIVLKNMPAAYSDDKMSELYDLLLTAQSNHKPVNKLVGSDTSRFCKDFFGDYSLLERLRFLPVGLYRSAWVIFIFQLVELLALDDPAKDFFTAKANFAGFGAGLLVCLAAYTIFEALLLPLFLKSKKSKTGPWYIAGTAIFVALFFGVLSLTDGITLMLHIHPFLLCSAIYIIVYIIVRAVWRFKNYGTVFNSRRRIEQDSYYANLRDKDMEKILLEGWQKRYERLERKGKTTAQTFLAKLQKEEKIERAIYKYFMPALAAVVGLFSVMDVVAESTLSDALFFAAVLGVIEFFIFRWIISTALKQCAFNSVYLTECEKLGMTMPDYISKKLDEM